MFKIKLFKSKQPDWAIRNAMAGCWATINSTTATHDQKVAAWEYLTANIAEKMKER